MDPRPTVYVVDDDEAVRLALTRQLESSGIQVQAFASAQEFIAAFDAALPGCLLLDVRMPRMTGLDLQAFLQGHELEIPIIMMSGQGDVASAVQAMKGGAVDFLEKPFSHKSLLDCVNRALARDVEDHRIRAKRLVFRERYMRLTPREREVYERVVAGEGVDEIARRLGLSSKTVYIHRSRIMEKLEADSIAELVRMAAWVKPHSQQLSETEPPPS